MKHLPLDVLQRVNIRHNVGKLEAILVSLEGRFLLITLVIVRITLTVMVRQMLLNVR